MVSNSSVKDENTNTGTIITIAEMIDQAIGNVEGSGSFINFSMLHAVLHCMAQQLRIINKQVDIRWTPALYPFADICRTVRVTEFAQTDGALEEFNDFSRPLPLDLQTMLVVEKQQQTQYTEDKDTGALGLSGLDVAAGTEATDRSMEKVAEETEAGAAGTVASTEADEEGAAVGSVRAVKFTLSTPTRATPVTNNEVSLPIIFASAASGLNVQLEGAMSERLRTKSNILTFGTYSTHEGDFGGGTLSSEYLEVKRMIEKCCDSISKNNSNLTDKMMLIDDQIVYVLNQMGIYAAELETNRITPEIAKKLEGALQLNDTVQEMQRQIKELEEATATLAAMKEQRAYRMNTLLERIELLKIIKVDREDMDDALLEKADLKQLATKVAYEVFEIKINELAKGLEHAIGKLDMLEAILHQALDDLQSDLDKKLNKCDFVVTKKYLYAKLEALEKNTSTKERREANAIGTKKKLLRDVNCISCDAKAVMPMEAKPRIPVKDPLPSTSTMRTYLSMELDAIHKTSLASKRTCSKLDSVRLMNRKPLQERRSDSENRLNKQMCGQYCEGYKMKTMPAQRVSRSGSFAKQWAPDVVQLTSGDDKECRCIDTKEGSLKVFKNVKQEQKQI